MRLHTDASHDEEVIGIAYVIEDDIENIYLEGNRYVVGEYTSMEAEYRALMLGIHAASWQEDGHLSVCTDCQPLVDKMNYLNHPSEKWNEMRSDCHELLNTFEGWTINYIPRSRNEAADRLAREALWLGREQ